MLVKWTAAASAVMLLVSCGPAAQDDVDTPRLIDAKALVEAAGNNDEWLTYNRTYDAQRFSPLHQIDTENVKDLGLAWFADLDTARGQEATPLVIDGNIYISTAWSKAKAYDGKSGEVLWEFDPKVPGETAGKACCDVVNRGLAAWDDKLFLGTLDGRLIALDRDTGEQVWSTMTVDPADSYTVTGAPIVIDGRVIIGNGGADYGVRGYITAYDATDGRQLWRFYTVPDRPGANEVDYLQRAEATWNGEWWKLGGGGTVWDAMAYDPELDLLYIGVGNGSPWNQAYRSPGGGDNLYLSSIVALKPETGDYVWHYQTTPGETWDYTATQHIILAELVIAGQQHKVLMQAPKNGFFYVLDRVTGELISANNFVPVNWAEGIDMETGRPIQNPDARIDKTGKPSFVLPGPGGAHSWHSMAFDPASGLVFIPAQDAGFPFIPEVGWESAALGFNTGMDFSAGAMPANPEVRAGAAAATKGALIAWDPVTQQERWRVNFNGPNNGGVLATGGGLVFQGNAAKEFAAFDASDGTRLWSTDVQTGVIAAPATFSIDGEQFVAVLAGWGGVYSLAPGILSEVSGPVRNISRLLVFKLGGSGELPPEAPLRRLPLNPPESSGTPEQVAEGARQYGRFCGTCHGDAAYGSTIVPDLRRSPLIIDGDAWASVAHEGTRGNLGMLGFGDVLTAEQIESIRHYVIMRANEDKALGNQ